MVGSLNKVMLIGNLGRDPELRSTQNGRRICNLSLATSESWRDRVTGDRQERTEWHRVVIFNEKLAEVAERYLRKGSKVFIEGQIRTRKWVDQSGQDRYSTEVILDGFRGNLTMLDSRSSSDDYQANRNSASPFEGNSPRSGDIGADDLDDDIPF